MLEALLLVLAGLLLLVAGGEGLVRGAAGIAARLRVPPTVVGLTIVAFGTSCPELVVSLGAALDGSGGIAVGNVVGSNIFNATAVLGLSALLRPLVVRGRTVRSEWPVMLAATVALVLMGGDGTVGRGEGAFLLLGLVACTVWAVRIARTVATSDERESFAASVAGADEPGSWPVLLAFTLGGVVLLAGGAALLVKGAVVLARLAGVTETVVGLTVVAAGTSLPELVTSCVASWRGQDDVAVANVVGSNVFNLLGIVGVTAVVQPLDMPGAILERDLFWMLGTTVLLLPLMKSGLRVTRFEGGVLTAVYLGYLVVLLR